MSPKYFSAILLSSLFLSAGEQALAATFSTDFGSYEDPISEGGIWLNGQLDGADWNNCATLGGMVQGRQDGGGGPSYNDSTALVTGAWGNDQTVSVTLFRGSVVEGDYPEVEIRLRSSLSSHFCTGYECFWSLRSTSDRYISIARWDGLFGDFTPLANVNGSTMPEDGDVLSATIVGSNIVMAINGNVVLTGTDSTWTNGMPGIGFDHHGPSSDDALFGFTSFTASDVIGMPMVTSEPKNQIVNLGDNAEFDVQAIGGTPLSYQWYFNNTSAIAGATNNRLVLSNVDYSNVGSYRVSVSNSFGSVFSDNAGLFVAKTYATEFPLNEDPIYEGGNWINGYSGGLDWSDVATTNGLAFGLQSGLAGNDDATALLAGTWGENQVVSANVHIGGGQHIGGQVELRLRSALSAHECTGYEVNFGVGNSSQGSVGIVRWNGALGDFTPLGWAGGPQCILNDGDEVKATIMGDTIVAYINGINVLQTTEDTFSSGNPGMGFYVSDPTLVNSDFGFTSFSASSDWDPVQIVVPPQSQVANLGSNVTFAVVASGSGPMSYQWYLDGIPIFGANNSQLVLANVQDADGGAYEVLVSNGLGSVLSVGAQLTVNHLPVPASPTIQRYWGAGFGIPDSVLLGTDDDGDSLSISSIGPLTAQGGMVSDLQGWVTYLPPAALTNDDIFDYTVSDGRGGFAVGTATITMITNQGPSLTVALENNPNVSVHLSGNGIANRTYTIQATDDLSNAHWLEIATVSSDASGNFEYEDTPPPLSVSRFYRVVTQ